MIGRLNHVAIAVRDIAAASQLYRDNPWARRCPRRCPQAEHGVTHRVCDPAEHQDRVPGAPLARIPPSPSSWSGTPTAASITSATRWMISSWRVTSSKRRRARVLGSGDPKIGAHGKPVHVPTSEGLQRHPGRTGTGLRSGRCRLEPSSPFISSSGGSACSRCCPWGVRAQAEVADIVPGERPRGAGTASIAAQDAGDDGAGGVDHPCHRLCDLKWRDRP